MKFYRYNDIDVYNHGIEVRLETLYLVRETDKGYWISHHPNYNEHATLHAVWDKPRWISKTSRKRYAYPTKSEALEGFYYRKRRAVELFHFSLEKARRALDVAKTMLKEMEKEGNED